jgi:hypothetical protein
MTAKTTAERQRAFKARMAEQGLTRCFVYVKPEHHTKIKAFAAALNGGNPPKNPTLPVDQLTRTSENDTVPEDSGYPQPPGSGQVAVT